MNGIDDFGRAYLRLALEINKHVDGYIDAYIGPPDLKAAVEAAEKRSTTALLDDLAALQRQTPTDDPARADYLRAVYRAMDCTLRIQGGEAIDYLDEVHRLYDIAPQKVDETVFSAAHRELELLLPGTGSLVERMEMWRKRYDLAADRLLPVLELARAETRRRTTQFVDLIAGEGIEIQLTQGQPWSAYNWYRGGGQSLIEFNTDFPVTATGVLGLFAHEGYPGHHTEGQLKEKLLYHEKGYAEQAALLLHSPSAVIAEGIATLALEIIFPDDSADAWNDEVLFPAAGIQPDPPEVIRQIHQAREQLRYVSGNAAILYNTGELTPEQTVDYFQTYALSSRPRAEKSFRFISHPLFRSYPFTYTEGYDLIRRATRAGDEKPLFRRLLTEQILPSQLAAM